MEKITGNEPAMPTDRIITDSFGNVEGIDTKRWSGLTMRQHFASLAMQGMLCQRGDVDRLLNEGNQSLTKSIASASVVVADALIKALNNANPQTNG